MIKINAFNKKETRYEVIGEKGLSPNPNRTSGPTDQGYAYFGNSVSTAGDVNGDCYSDVIIGAYGFDSQQVDEGRAYLYYGGEGDGLHLIPMQANQPGARVELLGTSNYNGIRLKLRGRSILGRAKVRLGAEIKEFGVPFNGTNTYLTSFYDTGVEGADINYLFSGLEQNRAYHWRARIVYHPVYYHAGLKATRWVTIFGKQSSGWNEQHFKTGALTGISEDMVKDTTYKSPPILECKPKV
ncbi:MAG: integrin alpha [Candidatus Hydrothermales bacterium]